MIDAIIMAAGIAVILAAVALPSWAERIARRDSKRAWEEVREILREEWKDALPPEEARS